MSTDSHPIKVVNTAPRHTMRANEITHETAKTVKVNAVAAVMSIFCRKKCNLQSANPGNEKPSCHKAETAEFLEESSCEPRDLSQKMRESQISKKLAPKSKRLGLNSTNPKLKHAKTHLNCVKKPDPSISYGLKVKNATIRVLLDAGSSGDLLFVKKGSFKHISVVKQAIPQLWGTSNGTFNTDKVGDIEISFVEYSASKKVCLQPDIIEYDPGGQPPMYDLIIGKLTLHNLGVGLDFKKKTIQIDEILLPTRNIANLQLKPSITRGTCTEFAKILNPLFDPQKCSDMLNSLT
jgi:hypothetical protein